MVSPRLGLVAGRPIACTSLGTIVRGFASCRAICRTAGMAARRMEQDRRNEDFRGMLARMEREGHLRRVTKTISPRHITALCGQAPSAVLCEAVEDYDIPVVGWPVLDPRPSGIRSRLAGRRARQPLCYRRGAAAIAGARERCAMPGSCVDGRRRRPHGAADPVHA